MASDRSFAQLVSLACHDLRTPLATVQGFARTIDRLEQLQEQAQRYIGLIVEGSDQLTELLDRLALVARIERGAYEPVMREMDSLEVAHAAAARVDVGEVAVSGAGAPVAVDPGRRSDRSPTSSSARSGMGTPAGSGARCRGTSSSSVPWTRR